MRNLRTVAYSDTTVESQLPLTATAWDSSNDSIICAFGPTSEKPVIELKRRTRLTTPEDRNGRIATSELSPLTSWDAPSPLPELPCDEILLMQYFPDTATVCLVLAGGDLILVREEPEDGQEKIEIVGSVDVGIAAAAWAPDEELLAVVTNSDNLVLMSRDLEPVTETAMTPQDLQASKHVSVGWGKKETQFQGKRAKAMRDPTMPEHVDEGVSSSNEDGKVTVSWRGDGAYLAVNAVVPNHRRLIRIYTREGILDSVSEPVDGLESALSWRPAGNLIASIKRSGQDDQTKLEVVFFERNGLRHGELSLRTSPAQTDSIAKQIKLAWNLDSTVLAVCFRGVVQLWTMGNYHYYLKQELKVAGSVPDSPTKLLWHPEKPLKCIASSADRLVDLEYLFQINRGSTVAPYDYGVTAVIDGATLKLTPFKHVGIPPPMCFCEVQAESTIIDVAISRNGQLLALLVSEGIEVYEWQMRASNGSNNGGELRHTTDLRKHKHFWKDSGLEPPEGTHFTQLLFQDDTNVFVLAPPQKGQAALCVQLRLDTSKKIADNADISVPSMEWLDVPVAAQNLIADCRQTAVLVQDGKLTSQISQMAANYISALVGGQPNSSIFQIGSGLDLDSIDGFESSFYKVSLSAKGILLADQTILARDCTSFVLTEQYLIFTTSQHLLKFVHLTNPERSTVPGNTPEVDERCRSIERGAKIVTVMPSTYAVVLQMPRGNLETIYPRVLVLNGIRDSLRKLEYRTAFVACQNHQVDMNILHDYRPTMFMDNTKKFVEDLKKPSRIDEFLSKLKEEDVTQTLYKDTLATTTETTAPTVNGVNGTSHFPHDNGQVKVNAICDALISVLKTKPGKFLQCIITAHVCKRPPDLTAALTLVSSLRQTSSEEADLAVSHLCFLTDTNRLFDAALALYDLELTLLVAQNAQRDPREYMPFLQNLQSLPTLRRQYQIDNHLRNYPKAITSLHATEAHDEVEAYTIKHSLYTHAMDLYRYAPTYLSKITNLYANHLASQSQHSAAAILYESLGSYVQAYPLYALAHQWRESLTCASLVPLDTDKLQNLASSLATSSADLNRDYRSAATIHTDYLSDPSGAAKLFCKGSYFADATRLLSLHNLRHEIPSTIDTALGDKFSEILELVSDCKSQLAAQVPRIQELRVKKAEDPLAFFGGDAAAAAADDGVDIPDNVSLAPTDATTAGGHSLFTRYGGSQASKFAGTVASNVSRKTSRTKRREERKRARGKKGSVYEEEYLVASVGRLIDRVNGVHEEVGRLVSGLLRRGMRERAKKVGEVMTEVVEACRKAKLDVWGVDEAEVQGDRAEGEEGEYRPSGADGVFWESQQGVSKEAPVVKTWKENVLLVS